MALCLGASVVSPAQIDNLQLFSLTTPFAIAANVFFFLFWIFSSRKLKMLPSFLILLASYRVVEAVFGYHFLAKDEWAEEEGRFKLMSWNVHAMGTFNHPHEKEYASGVVRFIKEEDPDIFIAPEFAVRAITQTSKYKDSIIRNGRYKSYYFTSDNGFGPMILIGTAIFSRFPIINYQAVFLDPYIAISYSDIVFPKKDTIRVFAVHLHTFGLSDEDKTYIEELKKRTATGLNQIRFFFWKFNYAYRLRAAEAEKLAAFIDDSPYPVIVGGDFNDLPFSYTYAKVRGELEDAFTERGVGFGRTYNQISPTLRIDHVFYNPGLFDVAAFKTPDVPWSDHRPLVMQMQIRRKQADD